MTTPADVGPAERPDPPPDRRATRLVAISRVVVALLAAVLALAALAVMVHGVQSARDLRRSDTVTVTVLGIHDGMLSISGGPLATDYSVPVSWAPEGTEPGDTFQIRHRDAPSSFWGVQLFRVTDTPVAEVANRVPAATVLGLAAALCTVQAIDTRSRRWWAWWTATVAIAVITPPVAAAVLLDAIADPAKLALAVALASVVALRVRNLRRPT